MLSRYCRSEKDVGNVIHVKIGNVTTETEFSFEYGVKKVAESDKREGHYKLRNKYQLISYVT